MNLSVNFAALLVVFLQWKYVNCDSCMFPNTYDNPMKERKSNMLKPLSPIFGKTASVKASIHGNSSLCTFTVGICSSAIKDFAGVGVAMDNGTRYSLGFLNSSDVIAVGNSYPMLVYEGGMNYIGTCSNGSSRSLITFSCNASLQQMTLALVEENDKKSTDCYYLFHIQSPDLCIKSMPSGLSHGSVLCILFFVSACIYLIIGCAYRRLVVGAKGMEQIPNFEFWKAFGRLEADGCDFMCRCGDHVGDRSYHDIDREIVHDLPNDPDDALLHP